MWCAGLYNLGLDGANFLRVGSKCVQRQGLKTNRELFLFKSLINLYFEKILDLDESGFGPTLRPKS